MQMGECAETGCLDIGSASNTFVQFEHLCHVFAEQSELPVMLQLRFPVDPIASGADQKMHCRDVIILHCYVSFSLQNQMFFFFFLQESLLRKDLQIRKLIFLIVKICWNQ